MKFLRNLGLLSVMLFVFVGCSHNNRRTSHYTEGPKKLKRSTVVRELRLLEVRTSRYNNRIDKEYVMKSDANLSPKIKHMQKGARKMEFIQKLLKRKLKGASEKIYFSSLEWYDCYDVGFRIYRRTLKK